METYTQLKSLVENPHFQDQRRRSRARLTDALIDKPIFGLINAFNDLPYCFTLQSCYGHFVHTGQKDPQNLEPLPLTDIPGPVTYRIAYIAFCIENSEPGRVLLDALKAFTGIDPANVQFGCAEWFWERHVNSYVLQVEPDRYVFEDTAILDYSEALEIERIRNEFFVMLYKVLEKQQGSI